MKKPLVLLLSTLLSVAAFTPASDAQRRHRPVRRTTVQPAAQNPNVSGQPAYLTAPSINNAPPEAQPQPQMNMNIKSRKKVRVVPAPPPPGPISPSIPAR